jgi:hypothetical protein
LKPRNDGCPRIDYINVHSYPKRTLSIIDVSNADSKHTMNGTQQG